VEVTGTVEVTCIVEITGTGEVPRIGKITYSCEVTRKERSQELPRYESELAISQVLAKSQAWSRSRGGGIFGSPVTSIGAWS
jgi:hypothetical protein